MDYQSLIKKIRPLDEAEARDKKAILKWLKSSEPIYREENPKAHLCAFFPLVDLTKGQLFLVHHKKSGLWIPNGGHVDKGETLEQAVVRELKEELDISWKKRLTPFFVSRIVTKGQDAGHIHNDIWFLVDLDQKTKFKPDKREFYDWRWFSFDKILKQTPENYLKRAIKKIKIL